jgi:hypothetical protein
LTRSASNHDIFKAAQASEDIGIEIMRLIIKSLCIRMD